ncbi:GtrA family protein [Sulfoacidibacillus thermotolerans]|uniref:GtrA/DPMS transmembrane domain-containing protein n=1 Tax=Sulfoacidibacillus thermotolerans TaxID=1765684 RepID=A0A2U3D691_SULT2|nr:GtrA family protein [Sulfoacidibacillus thermotolerans]PWI56795.1 hypothetical protein BM613_12010 [Sulfoacidibacillus thermotolerans]
MVHVSNRPLHPKKVALVKRRYQKFLLVGLINAFVDLAILNICLFAFPTSSSILLLIYNTIAVVGAITTSYILNRRFTFSDRATNSRKQILLFWLQGGLNVVINDAVLSFMARYFLRILNLPLFISGNLSKAAAMFLASSISYIILRLFVFRS